MNELLNTAISVCRAYIPQTPETIITDELLRNTAEIVCQMPAFTTIDKNRLFDELSALYNTRIDDFQILVGAARRERWLNDFKARHELTDWKFWNRYKLYLSEQKNFAPDIIKNNDDLTNEILDNLFDPSRNIELCKKGLVVGQVQSGKTSNYIGLICKAADAGFNVIIVLAGIHNNLRSQTQVRVDEGFLGFDTGSDKNYEIRQTIKIGVGRIPGFDDAIANSYTTSLEKGDFTSRAANTAGFNFNAPQPIILVVKKNVAVLKRLFNWLKTRSNNQDKITSKSLLLIDDEADNASINTKKNVNSDSTAINNNIRRILNIFKRAAYVGYTATPFANIFISANISDDLFPRDFIINIPPPSNYIGPAKVFGFDDSSEDNSVLPIVNIMDDYHNFVPDNPHKDDIKPTFDAIPESLKTAVKCFIITCAVRRLRGQENKHNSMLIHISRFQVWQECIKELVERLFNYYKQEIEADDIRIFEEFRKVYEEDTSVYCSYKTVTNKILQSPLAQLDKNICVHNWEDVKAQLFAAVQKIVVKSINGLSKDAIDYQINERKGISVIAIGGDKLSRGLTLEGLSISYFLRASKMYDTLMQMGRWFGYRPGYIDLCRLFTSNELNEWFRYIAIASEELRDDFDYMASIGATPEDYALKVRKHPGVLLITALNKMRNAKTIEVSWGGRLIETYQLVMDRGQKNKNLVITTNFINAMGQFEKVKEDYLWRNISPDKVCSFIQEFVLPPKMESLNMGLIAQYIKKLVDIGELVAWNVALISNKKTGKKYSFGNGIEVICGKRTRDTEQGNDNIYYIRKNHIVGNRTDEYIDLDDNLLERALKRTKETNTQWTSPDPMPKIVRKEFRPTTTPLLMIYPLNPKYANVLDKQNNIVKGTDVYTEEDTPFIGFAISFPHTDSTIAISYAINQSLGVDFAETEEYFEENNDNEYDE